MNKPTQGAGGREEISWNETNKEIENMMRKIEMRLMKRMDALESKVMKEIGEQRSQNEHTKIVCDPEDSDSPDAKRYNTMLREASKAMDRQLEEICQMEQENKGKKVDNYKANLREGAANISQDENEVGTEKSVTITS